MIRCFDIVFEHQTYSSTCTGTNKLLYDERLHLSAFYRHQMKNIRNSPSGYPNNRVGKTENRRHGWRLFTGRRFNGHLFTVEWPSEKVFCFFVGDTALRWSRMRTHVCRLRLINNRQRLILRLTRIGCVVAHHCRRGHRS